MCKLEVSGEILFSDESIVFFKGLQGAFCENIAYFDENGEEVPYDKIVGKRYDRCILFNRPIRGGYKEAMQRYKQALRRYEERVER